MKLRVGDRVLINPRLVFGAWYGRVWVNTCIHERQGNVLVIASINHDPTGNLYTMKGCPQNTFFSEELFFKPKQGWKYY